MGLQKLPGDAGVRAAARIRSGELSVRVEAEFGASLCTTCQIVDRDGVVAYDFSLEGLQRIEFDAKAN